MYRFVHDEIYIIHINTHKTRLNELVKLWISLELTRSMWNHKQNYNLNQLVGDTKNDAIVMESQNYFLTKILKPATILAK